MSIIKLPIRYEGSQGDKILYTLFDSGATFSCINAADVKGIEKLVRLKKPKIVATAAEGYAQADARTGGGESRQAGSNANPASAGSRKADRSDG